MNPEQASPDPTPQKQGIPLPLIRWRGFTLQMFLFIFLPLSVILLVIVFISQSVHHNEMRALVGDRDLRAVRASANNLSNEIDHQATALAALAFQAQNWRTDPRFLDDAAQRNGFDGGLVVFDSQRKKVAQSTGASPDLLEYQRVVGSGLTRVGADPGMPVRLSPPVRSADGRWLLLGLAQVDENYALAGAFTPNSLARQALAGVAGDQSAVMLVSPQGDLLYASGPVEQSKPVTQYPGVADVLRGESGVNYMYAEGSGMTGHSGEHVIAFSPVAPFGWGLVLQEPWEQSAGPLLNVTQSAPLILAPVLALALLALWFGARQVIQPLQALEKRAGRSASRSEV
jgi:hypothetical protein